MPSYSRYRSRGQMNGPVTQRETWYPLSCANRVSYYMDFPSSWGTGTFEYCLDNNIGSQWRNRKVGSFVFNDFYKNRSTRSISGSSDLTITSVANTCTSPNIKSTDNSVGHVFTQWINGGNPPGHLLSGGVSDSDLNALVEEVWTQCLAKRGEGNANLLETLAELDKTMAMVQAPFENLTALIKTFRRNGKRMKGYLKVAADSKALIVFASSEWLRFRYGVMPIINDVKAIMKTLETGHSPVAMPFTARSSGEVSVPTVVTGSLTSAGKFRVDYSISDVHTVKVRAFYVDVYTRSVWTDLGFTLRNAFGLAYELTRYSFVKDWFTSLGNHIYANAPKVFHSSAGGQVSIVNTRVTEYSPYATVALAPATWTITGSVSDKPKIESIVKSRYSKEPRSTYLVKSNFGFDKFNRSADAVSVAIQWLNSIAFNRH